MGQFLYCFRLFLLFDLLRNTQVLLKKAPQVQIWAYAPMLGRWLSRDPLGEDAGTNLFAYVGNGSVGFLDPLGLFDFSTEGEFGIFGPGLGYLAEKPGSHTPEVATWAAGAGLGEAGVFGIGLTLAELKAAVAGLKAALIARKTSTTTSTLDANPCSIQKVKNMPEDFLGPGYTKESSPSSDLMLRSADGLRQVRFDLVNSHGMKPHINIEVFSPIHSGSLRMKRDINVHAYPKSD